MRWEDRDGMRVGLHGRVRIGWKGRDGRKEGRNVAGSENRDGMRGKGWNGKAMMV